MKVNAAMASFYNASSASRLSSVNSVNASQKVNSAQGSAGTGSGSRDSASQYLSEHGGVVQTRVSPENAYQKTMLSDPRYGIERMASKLMTKLPDILKDMQNVSDYNENADSAASGSSKVIITKAGSQNTSNTAAASTAMMDFAL